MRIALLSLTAVTALLTHTSSAVAVETQTVPPGFRRIDSAQGVTLWRKNREYVQIVSLQDGAILHLLHGTMIPSDGAGTNFSRKSIRDWWTDWSTQERSAYSLINAQFFNTNNPAKSPLAFSTKIDGIVYAGYGDASEYPGRKLLLRLGAQSATVEPYDDDAGSLYQYEEDNIIVGLRPDASKAGNVRRGRTFVGTTHDGNILIFTSPAATQRYAHRILLAFGAARSTVLMLDGGGSTQFVHDGTLLIPTNKTDAQSLARAVPLALGVTTGR